MKNKKQGIGLIVTVVIIAVIAVVIATILLVVNKNDNKVNTNENGEQNLNSNVINNNNEYEVITEELVRNHNVTPVSEFKYEINAQGVRITKHLGSDTIVVVPETIEGKTVTDIALSTFANDSKVRGVYIPAGVQELEATFGNNKCIEVVICEGTKKIGTGVFNGCKSLHTVILSNEITSMGSSAFANCPNLKELYVSSSLNSFDTQQINTIFLLSKNLTIKGEAGSFIESYCKEYNIPFVAE